MRLLFSRSTPPVPGILPDAELVDLYRHPMPTGAGVWVRSNFVTSLDGSIQGSDGRSGSINTPSDQRLFALHRALADVVLVGAGTVRAEGYRAVELAPWTVPLRSSPGRSDRPTLAIVSHSLELSRDLTHAHGGPVVIFTTQGKGADQVRPFTAAGVEVIQLSPDNVESPGNVDGPGNVDLAALLDELATRGLSRVLCEGGPRLHRDLLVANLLDEMSWSIAPVVVAGPGSRTTTGAALAPPGEFALQSVLLSDDGTLFLRYRTSRTAQAPHAHLGHPL